MRGERSMSYILVAALGFLVGYVVRSVDTSRHRLADDIAFIRSLPEPPSNVTVVDDDTDGLTL